MSDAREHLFSGEFNNIPSLTDKAVLSLLPDPWWPEIVEASRPYQDARDDDGHAAAVLMLAAAMCPAEESRVTGSEVDRRTVLTTALLHDIGWSQIEHSRRFRLFDRDLSSSAEHQLRLEHERLGKELARRLMTAAGCPEVLLDSVCELISGHDTQIHFKSAEDCILKDADKLWMVTDRGFTADLRRRRIPAGQWADILRRRFLKKGVICSAGAAAAALERLSELEASEMCSRPNILIAHYRVGWTDGVSLEIEKRKVILEEMGFRVFLLSGPGSRGADFIIDELDFEAEHVKRIAKNAFGKLADMTEKQLSAEIYKLSDIIEAKLSEIILKIEPDFILTHNIFSHGRHIAAARSFYNVLRSYGAASLTTHHDFYWERDDFKTPSCGMVTEYLDKYVPPEIPGMKHAVINHLAAVELERHCGIKPMIFPDTLDFSVRPWMKDDYNCHFYEDFNLNEHDILILQATRIVRRKGIELIPPIISCLNSPEHLELLKGKRLFNGKLVTAESRFVFLLAGYAEHEAETYREQLKTLMEDLNIDFRFLHPGIAAERGETDDGRRVYSLFDTYPYADLVSYPSLYEGWGNQFIEAVFARKPVILYEYPVFKSDIKHIGYDVISMGSSAELVPATGLYKLPGKQIESTCTEIIDWLLSSETPELLKKNFRLAKENNSYEYLRQLMKQSMEHYEYYENL